MVWILDRLGVGGAERMALRFAAAPLPWQVELVALEAAPFDTLAGFWGEQITALRGHVHGIGIRGLDDAAGWWRLLRLLAGWQPLLVHTHLRYATVWGGLAARLLRRPYVTTVHLGPCPDATAAQRAIAACERYSRRRAARVVYVSAAQRQAWGDTAQHERTVVIGNGIALAREGVYGDLPRPALRRALGLPPAATIFVTVAVAHAAKGWRTWLAACELIAHRRPDARFVWVGGGGEWEQLRRAADASPARGQFVLPGSSHAVPAWLRASDLFLFPSQWEAQPTAVLEAMAAALPVIATRLPAIEEVLGGCGRLIPVDDAAALAGAAIEWSEPACEAARAAGEAARRRAEGALSETHWCERMVRLYEEVLAC